MSCKFHVVHISIDIYPNSYIYLSSNLHRKFQFRNGKNLELKKIQILENPKKQLIFKSIDLMQSILCRRKNEL